LEAFPINSIFPLKVTVEALESHILLPFSIYRLNRDSSLVTYICYLLIRLIHDNINKIKISYKYKKEVRKLAFGDNGPRKKTPFEKLTLIVVIIMVLVTVGALVLSALSAVI
jgi:hypothetical protein